MVKKHNMTIILYQLKTKCILQSAHYKLVYNLLSQKYFEVMSMY